jgi:hypothetical protein
MGGFGVAGDVVMVVVVVVVVLGGRAWGSVCVCVCGGVD